MLCLQGVCRFRGSKRGGGRVEKGRARPAPLWTAAATTARLPARLATLPRAADLKEACRHGPDAPGGLGGRCQEEVEPAAGHRRRRALGHVCGVNLTQARRREIENVKVDGWGSLGPETSGRQCGAMALRRSPIYRRVPTCTLHRFLRSNLCA